jgi:sulfur-oxidizing protein SoxA
MSGAGHFGTGRWVVAALVASCLAAAAAVSASAQGEPLVFEVEGRKSGYLFLTPGTRALQDDDFQNPAAFALDRGRELWNRPEGPNRQSCASCHGEAESSMRGVATRYPMLNEAGSELVNLELRINAERRDRMQAPAFTYESADMLALTAYVAHQSRGQRIVVNIDDKLQPFFEKGREFYFQRRGQLDISCAQCHDALVGSRLRGDVISQGQVNGFPIYRVSWQAMASRHRLFAWCNTSVRAEPFALGSEEYLNLELFMAWRSRGLSIETPAVRR